MKRITCLILTLVSVTVFAQKQPKPNINKALSAWKEGKLAEAKDIIDAATTHEKTMGDGNTWYYRGLIYASLDTTSNEQFKSLEADPLKVSLESFAKAETLAKGGKEYFVTGSDGLLPVTKPQQMEALANHYVDKGIKQFQDDQDYEASLKSLDKASLVSQQVPNYPNDTLIYYVRGLVGQQAENHDVAIESITKYFEKGGKSKDGYIVLYQIYNSGPKENKQKALEVVREAKVKFPENPDFPKLEIGLLIELNKIDEARVGLENAVKADPSNAILTFYLGYVNAKLADNERKKSDSLFNASRGKPDAKAQEKINALNASATRYNDVARQNFEAALKIDPSHFEAQYYLAQLYFIDAEKVRNEIKNLGISAADKKRQAELDKVLVEKYKIALPHWEKAEKLSPKDVDVLDRLRTIYYYLGDDKNEQRVSARLKQLGADEN